MVLNLLIKLFGKKQNLPSDTSALSWNEETKTPVSDSECCVTEKTTVTETGCIKVDLSPVYHVQSPSSECESLPLKSICESVSLEGVPFAINEKLESKAEINNIMREVFLCVENLKKYDNIKPWTDDYYTFNVEKIVLKQ
ncbi:uncharacterized protein LOC143234519 [Tachypleus tridentatus]|uniref:uncharacterized protein LOC143234519 n=1 Tax=Tachypleus tridentatus TaxID=6853 RepID=UPI003FD3D1FB